MMLPIVILSSYFTYSKIKKEVSKYLKYIPVNNADSKLSNIRITLVKRLL